MGEDEAAAAAGATGKYEVGLCDCFDEPMQALITCFLPCVAFGELYAARQGEAEPLGSTPCLIGGAITCVPILNWIFIGMQRSEFQQELGFPDEGMAKNLLLALCCGCCAITQDRRQFMKSKGEPKLFLFN